ncbi:hypothetical protein J6590_088298 [Homalodisca vitripennis]|nr:hypothetical protein J6590_088298 [Homalodisca vitripennis]
MKVAAPEDVSGITITDESVQSSLPVSPQPLQPGCLPRRVWNQSSEPTSPAMSPTAPDTYALPGWAHYERDPSTWSPGIEETEEEMSPTVVGCRPRQIWSKQPRQDDVSSKPTGMRALPNWAQECIRQEIEDIQRAPRRPEPQSLSPRDEDLPTWAAHPGCLPRRAWDRPQGEPFKESPTTAGVAALPDWARQEEQIEVGCKPRKTWSRKPPRDDDSDQV